MFSKKHLALFLRVIWRLCVQAKYITYHGSKVYVPRNIPFRFRLNIYLERYESHEIRACITNIGSNVETIIEIGGGIGILSKIINDIYRPSTHLIFEPIKSNFDTIKKQNLPQNVRVVNKAVVSDETETISFFKKEMLFGSGFIKNSSERVQGTDIWPVDIENLDNINFKDCDILILDVEGYEEDLLPDIALRCPEAWIIFEYHQTKVANSLTNLVNSTSRDLFHFDGNVFYLKPKSY